MNLGRRRYRVLTRTLYTIVHFSPVQAVRMSLLFATEDISTFGQILLLCLLICVFLSGKAIWEHSFSKLPPGPWGLPLIGEN